MNELIQVAERHIGDGAIQTVNARELHAFLGVGKDFSTWMNDRIQQYGFVENQDFICFPISGSKERSGRGGSNRKDYHLTLDMAKELAMVERNDKGREARQYFIECERRAKANVIDITTALADPAKLRTVLLGYTEKVMELEAKVLQMPEKQFLQFANAKGFIFRNRHSRIWQGYSDKAKAGLVELKLTTVERDDGSSKTVEQVLITRAGIAKLAQMLGRGGQSGVAA